MLYCFVNFFLVAFRSDVTVRKMRRDLYSGPVDILVTTPKVFLAMHEKKHVFFSDVRHVVVDEADLLLSSDFKDQVIEKIIKPCKHRKAQFTFVLATLNNDTEPD